MTPHPTGKPPPVTLAEYLDPTRFPLTTRAGLPPDVQVVADAIALDKLRAYPAYGVTPTGEVLVRLAELEVKEKVWPWLLAELCDAAGLLTGPI